MLIRHDPQLSRGSILMPVPRRQWMPPSRAQQKTFLGHEDRTVFRLRARAHDGHVVWQGWFEDRDDADAFLFALFSGSLPFERALWRMPSSEWHPGISTDLVYEFMAQTILTTTGSNQTYTSPSDWDNASNTIRCLGGGASGGRIGGQTQGHPTGGGGGAYSAITNFVFATPGTTNATYRIGIGGSSGSSSSVVPGNAGGASWFNASADPGNGADNSKCSAAGGTQGAAGTGSQNGGAGGAAGSSWGQTKYSGGRGGNMTGSSGSGGSGSGGAAGPSGNGGNGVESSSTGTTVATAGGSANNGTTAGGSPQNNGNNGTEFSASYGCGSGGGGYSSVSGNTAGSGGNYGGAGGASGSLYTATSGAGRQGLVVVEYTPYVPKSLLWNPRQYIQHILVR